jgi:general secretion pathway protein F
LAALAAALALSGYALASEAGRARFNERLWRIPSAGRRMKIYQLARFYRTVGMLLLAGIPIVRAVDMVSGLLAPHLRNALTGAKSSLEEGRSISSALANAGLATPIALRMLSVGERSGQMGEMMARIARFYDDDTARYLDRFTRAFEPILMAVLGLAVGTIVVLMYMPIFELAGSFQ